MRICLYGYSDDDNEDYDGNQGCGPDVEAAGSGGVVLGSTQITSHLPVSGLGGQSILCFLVVQHNYF